MTSVVHRAARSVATGLAVTLGAVFVGIAVPGVAAADTAPAAGTPVTVSADVLPTAQIDGVVWSQAVAGGLVWAGGDFKNARPAGSAPGVNTVPRGNLMAYDIRTGQLVTSIAPSLNGPVRAVAASPDGTRVYVGGTFTSANGASSYRIAAYNAVTGALITTFRPSVDATVTSIAATSDTVYVGGSFSSANNVARSRLAAFRASDGALTAWAPRADASVSALVVTGNGSKVIAGGSFATMNGASALGLAALDPTTGASLPWAAGKVVQAYGTGAAFNSLSTDGVNVYGTAYNYYGTGNLEGTFAARADTGDIAWIEDCHGDTYGAYAQGDVVYTVSHAHTCETLVDGFPETNPRTNHHALAFTVAPVNKLLPNRFEGYGDFTGQPAPALLRWYPDLAIGNYTGQNQAGWNVTGDSSYVVTGGEFPSVNGVPQQGLVRFAKTPVAPGKSGPVISASQTAPTVVSLSSGTARVSFLASWDRDNEKLTYNVYRDGAATPAYTTAAKSTFWDRPTFGFADSGLAPGSRHRYRVVVADPNGNSVTSPDVYVTVSSDASPHPYADAVASDGASSFWRLGEGSGTLAYDSSGFSNLTLTGGITRGAAGAITADSDTATSFDGMTKTTTTGSTTVTTTTNGYTPSPVSSPDTFTVEAWVKTTSTQGGKVVGFGNAQTGNSNTYDRHVYMDNAGRLYFGVYRGGTRTISTPGSYNDGAWHQVVAQLSPAGMAFYVDGVRIGADSGVTSGDAIYGYWRIGGDNLGGWPNTPSSNYLNGSIDDVSIYPTALSATQVRNHFTLTGRTVPGASRPSDAYGQRVYDSGPDSYWRLDEAAGATTAADSSASSSPATYVAGVTQGAAGALPGGQGTAAVFNGSTGLLVGTQRVSNPRTYSQELWFKTTTGRGGKLIGFGSATTGNSNNYDRHVYMLDSGRLRFGVWTGQANLIDTPQAYNDGAWHQLVATQNTTDGMRLYVDGALVGSNPQTSAEAYDGYWRVGGDNTWGGASSNYFAGTIDEVAVYASALSASDVVAHYRAGGGQVPNQAPTASFTAAANGLTATFNGSASADADGTVASYAWTFGDGTTGTGATPSHTYAAAGTYTVGLTVTDDRGATGSTTKAISVVKANAAPVASFTSTATGLRASFDASASSDSDGSVSSYAWAFGDSATGTGVTASHDYAKGGTYQVTLTVTDDKGLTSSITKSVTVTTPNVAPTASFTSTSSGLTASFDGSGSSDSDGTVASYAWAFGDGTSGTGATPAHAYGAAGTYQVTLTVTDDKGLTGRTTNAVTVAAATTYATDAFSRTVTGGLGTADTGGAWTLFGKATSFAVNGGAGRITAPAAGQTSAAALAAVAATQTDARVDVSLDKEQTGGGTYVSVVGRRVDAGNDYRVRVRYTADGKVSATIVKVVAGTETSLTAVTVPGLTYTAGAVMRVRVQVTGTSPTTVRARVWPAAAAEPSTWVVSASDATAALQAPGGVGLVAYLSGAATNAPMTASFDNLVVGAPVGG